MKNQKFQGFPLTRKTTWKTIAGDAALLVALVAALSIIFNIGVLVGL